MADLGSAYKLAPQSLGLPQTVNFSMRVSLLILRLGEVSSLSVGNYIQFGRSHKSDFHGITQFGSKICHRSVTCVTCDTCALQFVTAMPRSIPFDVVLFTQGIAHNMHCYIVSQCIIGADITYLVMDVITML